MEATDKKFTEEIVREFQDGDVVFREGDRTREMYVIQEGGVVITKQSGARELELAVLKKGDFLGEMSLLESLPRSATARVRGTTRLLILQPGGFLLKIRRDPTFAFEMLQQLSRRIRVTNEKLMASMNAGRSSRESISEILQGAEFHDRDGKAV